jgi:phosphatidylserine/phosphatidylglycerophosphate/cardiolipin synthase-like enzyme
MKFGFILVSLCLLGATSARATVDIVESVPVETTLAVPGVQDTQASWIELINASTTMIDMEEFYISLGDSLQPVLDALKAAAARGVKIRLMLDSKFYANSPVGANAFALIPNVQIKTIDFSSYGGIMHAKYFVVDNQLAYVGSANFDWLALSHIHEIGMKINDGSIAKGLEAIFNLDWPKGVAHTATKNGGHHTTPTTSPTTAPTAGATLPLQIFASPNADLPAGVSPTLDQLTKLMGAATSKIQIQVYEYDTKNRGGGAPFTTLDTAIRTAAARGVKVQLCVDQTALKAGKADLQALAHLANIEVKVVTIPQWSGGPLQYARLIHSKYMIVDGKTAWVGSENWEGSYFTGTRNVGLVTTDSTALGKLGQIYSNVWNSTYTAAP